MVPFILVLADLGRNDGQNAAAVVFKAVIDAIRNPLITAILAGVAVAALGIELPLLVAKPASLLGVAGPGLALFFAGAILQSAKMSGQFSVVTGITALKLFIFPAAMYVGLLAAQWLTASLGWPAISKELLSAIFVLSTMPMIGVLFRWLPSMASERAPPLPCYQPRYWRPSPSQPRYGWRRT